MCINACIYYNHTYLKSSLYYVFLACYWHIMLDRTMPFLFSETLNAQTAYAVSVLPHILVPFCVGIGRRGLRQWGNFHGGLVSFKCIFWHWFKLYRYLLVIALMWFKHVLKLKGKVCVLQNSCPNALCEDATVKLLSCAICLGQSSMAGKDS